ncbi:hypothetical protein CM19_04270 [Candidatus Acidianus copahuensis]|uniref:DUF1177 domain-containing protein n=2 Tax=Candidatus Acidianus copahuensis TaxID=1160895 RepID=A0A031LRZ7_9CREN|nr:DUF1177 family protein [Candidatus Acidianus copahuensis]EZQ10274.1 hypothetical protein CM19_04270 [Candidatus Acidianus copahuensis]
MMLKSVIETIELLQDLKKPGDILDYVKKYSDEVQYWDLGEVLFLRSYIKGEGKKIEVLGRLGSIKINNLLVSDADGAIIALAVLRELSKERQSGNYVISTSISLSAKLIQHEPFNFMVPPIGIEEALNYEVDKQADFIISIDSTKGNRIAKYSDFAITHVIKDGYIMKVSDEVLDIYEKVTDHEPYFVPLTSSDLTPMDFNSYHISTLISPWLYTESPLIGVATVSKFAIPGYETGVQNISMLENAGKFCVELSRFINKGGSAFDEKELIELKNKLGESNLLKVKRK